MTEAFDKRNSSQDKNSLLKGNYAKSSSPGSATGANWKPNIEKKDMTERERLQASLKATLTEYKQVSA